MAEAASTSPDSAWPAVWRRDIADAVAALVAGFEERFGYPPSDDGNAVTEPDADDLEAANLLAGEPAVASALPRFYQHIARVDLADVGNAFFLHSAADVRHYLEDSGPIEIPAHGPATFFASDGGGIHFVIAADGTIHRSTAASRESAFELIAEDLREFLDRLRACVIGFLETGDPGDL